MLRTQLRGNRDYKHSITKTNIETVMTNFPVNNIQGPDDVTGVLWTIKINVKHAHIKLLQKYYSGRKTFKLILQVQHHPDSKAKVSRKGKL